MGVAVRCADRSKSVTANRIDAARKEIVIRCVMVRTAHLHSTVRSHLKNRVANAEMSGALILHEHSDATPRVRWQLLPLRTCRKGDRGDKYSQALLDYGPSRVCPSHTANFTTAARQQAAHAAL